MLSLPLYLQSIHNKEFERNLHTAGSYLLLSECSLGIHSMFSLLFLTVNVHHKQPQQRVDFSLFLLTLYLLWDNFLISEMTSIHTNNTKTPCQPQSGHFLGMLIAKTWHFHNCMISHFERNVNEICSLFGFYAASIGSFLPTFRENSWWLWNSHSGVGEDSGHQGCSALSTGQCTFIFRTSSRRCTAFHRNVHNPSPVDRA